MPEASLMATQKGVRGVERRGHPVPIEANTDRLVLIDPITSRIEALGYEWGRTGQVQSNEPKEVLTGWQENVEV